ncbi:MAG: rod-binding protein [Rhodospirillaceae bacterium]
MMDAASLLDNAKDAYVTGLSAQATKKAGVPAKAVPGLQMSAADEKKVREAAQEFEAFFIGQMMEHMMAGIEPNPMFGGGHGEQMWRSMLNQEYGKELAKSNKLGIADHVMRGMLMAQEQRDADATGRSPIAPRESNGADLQTRSQPPAMPVRRSF